MGLDTWVAGLGGAAEGFTNAQRYADAQQLERDKLRQRAQDQEEARQLRELIAVLQETGRNGRAQLASDTSTRNTDTRVGASLDIADQRDTLARDQMTEKADQFWGGTMPLGWASDATKRAIADQRDTTTRRGQDASAATAAAKQATPAGEGQAPSTYDPGTRQYDIATDLATGKLTFQQFAQLYPTRGQGPQAVERQRIYETARQLNPEFDAARAGLGYKAAADSGLRNRRIAITALTPVIDQIVQLSNGLSRTDLPTFNRLLNETRFQVGNRRVTSLRQLQTLLGEEVGNALGVGTASDLKTKLGLDLVNPNLGVDGFRDTMTQLQSVLNARLQEIDRTQGIYAPKPSPPVRPAGAPRGAATAIPSPGAGTPAPTSAPSAPAAPGMTYQNYLRSRGAK